LRFFPENSVLLQKYGDYEYRMGNYTEALDSYWQADCANSSDCRLYFHNLGNIYFEKWKWQSQKILTISDWKFSLQAYLKSLNYEQNQETKENYDYVKKQLKDLLTQIPPEEKKEPPLQPQNKPKDQQPQDETKQKEEQQQEQQKEENEQQKTSHPPETPPIQTPQNSKPSTPNSSKWKTSPQKPSQPQTPTPQSNTQQNAQKVPQANQGQDPNATIQNGSGELQIVPKMDSLKFSDDSSQVNRILTPDENNQIEWYLDQLYKEEIDYRKLNIPQSGDSFQDELYKNYFQSPESKAIDR